jgi:hypothetical protein
VLAQHALETGDHKAALDLAARAIAHPMHDAFSRQRYISLVVLIFECCDALSRGSEMLKPIDDVLSLCIVGDGWDEKLHALRDAWAAKIREDEVRRAESSLAALLKLSPGLAPALQLAQPGLARDLCERARRPGTAPHRITTIKLLES